MNYRSMGGILACVITLPSAAFAEDNTSILVNGFGTNIPGTVTIGSTGTNNSLQITLAGSVTNNAGVIGDAASASNNFVIVDGTGSLWTNTISGGFDGIIVGRSGDNNRLTISDGGRVDAQDGIIGRFGGADNNSILITGNNSFLNITRFFDVGTLGSGNQLVITNGGRLNNVTESRIGGVGGAINNSVLITGAGSIWSNTANLKVGASSAAQNSVTVANGGTLRNTLGFLGEIAGANSNSVTVTGAGSRWINTGLGGESINVGRGGSYNQLVISDGGRVDGVDIYLGRFSGANSNSVLITGANSLLNISTFVDVGTSGANNQLVISSGGRLVNVAETRIGAVGGADGNSVVVTGSGSTWSNSNNLIVGDAGSANQLIVTNGGTVRLADTPNTGTSLIIGRTASSSNNLVRIDGGNLIVTNATGATPGIDVRRGTLVFDSGTIDTERLLANTGSSGTVDFNGGTLVTRGTTVANGNTFVVGDGVSVAKLQLQGGTHSFADGLSISANGTLSGNGIVSGATTVHGTLAPGNSPGLIQFGDLTLATNSTFAVELNGLTAGSQYDQADVNGLVTLSNGFLSVLIGFSPVVSNQFVIIDNDGIDPVSGIFDGLTEGSIVSGGGATKLSISYVGGDGNDVVLTFLVPEPGTVTLLLAGALLLRRRRK